MSAKYGVLLVGGARSHQENYARDFAADPRCRLIGVTDEVDVPEPRKSWLHDLAAELDLPVFPDLDTALQRDDVDIASICVEFERRGPVSARCAAAGKHVYIDKPMAASNEHAALVVEAVKKAKVKSQMFSMAQSGWVQRARTLVESGVLGDLLGLHCDLLFTKGPAGTADLSKPRQEKYPPRRYTFVECKRELFTTAVYSIGLIRTMHSRPITRVYAQTSNFFFKEHQQNDVEDFTAISLEFDDGMNATITGGRIGWLSSHGGPVRILLIGDQSSRLVDAAEPRLEVACDAPRWRPPPPNPDDPMGFWSSTNRSWGGVHKFDWSALPPSGTSEATYFVDCIEADRESEVNAAEGAEILRIMLAAYESAALGEPISV